MDPTPRWRLAVAMIGVMKRQGGGPIQSEQSCAGLHLAQSMDRHPNEEGRIREGMDNR
jgi:hypothetical protein